MKPLGIPDIHHLRAALGWLGLGDHLEADVELDKISPELRSHPDVLEIRWQIYAKESKWEACREIARSITERAPQRVSGWLHLSYATRRTTDGGVEAALDILRDIVERFSGIWEIPYNLACYSSVLGRFDEAQNWFKKAIVIDDKTVQKLGIDDPDLKPLWDSMSTTIWKKSE